MASGNDGDPPRAHGRRGSNGRRLSQEPNSEDQVVEETEEVFRSYAFYRYQQEREERGDEVPMDPEIVEIEQHLGSTGSRVGRRLAIIGDDINERYDAEFRYMLKSLQPTKENAYEYFTKIASSLFESGINWGRVIALLGFGYRMAIYVYQHGIPGFLRRIARYVAEFMLRNRIAQWIAQQGGWVSQRERGAIPGGFGGEGRQMCSNQWKVQPGDNGTAEAGGATQLQAEQQPGPGRSNVLWLFSVSR
ncbi:bcl-2 homologous antagonist/killer isoform X1 [Chroicocephalus ridibundus]|uniref:bcl-2 homologous antagonist/killer isoform X1 n=1 Tax=Chroicocephalus ridibundus TaxID=1192867 RepID=UPI002FDCB4F6